MNKTVMSKNKELISKSDVVNDTKFDGVPNSLDQESFEESKTRSLSEAKKLE